MALFQDNRPLLFRLNLLRAVFAVAIVVLVGRLWHLSIARFEHYDQLAHNNRLRTVPLMAPRGIIIDRRGRVLVENRHSSTLHLYFDDVVLDETIAFIAEGLDIPLDEARQTVLSARPRNRFRPVPIRSALTFDQVAFFMSRQNEHPEIRITQQPLRVYPQGRLAAHVLGYVGEVTEQQLKSEFAGRNPGDVVGKAGVERTHDPWLTGKDGYVNLLVNSRGKAMRELGEVDPVDGRTLRLTIDLDLQRAAEESLGEDPGAIVAIDPRSGEVLAMASLPSFDPNAFARGLSRAEWEGLLSDPEGPLTNRAIQAALPPGSLFKVLMAVAGLETEKATPQRTTYCTGSVTLYGHPFGCSHKGGHGSMRLVGAIEHSCNIYFYLLGRDMGVDVISRYADLFGLGQATGIDLPAEAIGLAPSREWKERVRGEPWYPGDTISVSIGQGLINATPLQMARAMGMVATGAAARPHVVIAEEPEAPPARAPLETAHLALVRQAMWRVVNGDGTGRGAAVRGFDVCGKTGTAQVIAKATKETLSEEKKQRYADNAWFAGFAPRDDPEIVVVVIVQRGGSGGAAAAPLARNIFQTYYDKRELNPADLAMRKP